MRGKSIDGENDNEDFLVSERLSGYDDDNEDEEENGEEEEKEEEEGEQLLEHDNDNGTELAVGDLSLGQEEVVEGS